MKRNTLWLAALTLLTFPPFSQADPSVQASVSFTVRPSQWIVQSGQWSCLDTQLLLSSTHQADGIMVVDQLKAEPPLADPQPMLTETYRPNPWQGFLAQSGAGQCFSSALTESEGKTMLGPEGPGEYQAWAAVHAHGQVGIDPNAQVDAAMELMTNWTLARAAIGDPSVQTIDAYTFTLNDGSLDGDTEGGWRFSKIAVDGDFGHLHWAIENHLPYFNIQTQYDFAWRLWLKPGWTMCLDFDPAAGCIQTAPSPATQADLFLCLYPGFNGSSWAAPNSPHSITLFHQVDPGSEQSTAKFMLSSEVAGRGNQTETNSGNSARALGMNVLNLSPVTGRLTVNLTLPHSGPVDLTVFDLLGRRRGTLVHETLNAGLHQLHWSTPSDLEAGLYFLRLQANGSDRQAKVIIQH